MLMVTATTAVAGAVLPMKAIPGPVPVEPGWAFEFTWDGVRTLAEVGRDQVRLLGGREGRLAGAYPELDVLPALTEHRLLLDGKIVALDACGKPSFSRLAQRMHLRRPSMSVLRRIPVAYYVFDLLRLDDRSTLEMPYWQRRELLAELNLSGGPIVLPPSFSEVDGQAVLDTAARYGLHGVVAKRVDSTYQPGRRSRNWIQTTLRRSQEVVIGGWIPEHRGFGDGFSSLLLGVPDEDGVRYVGQVSAGFTAAARTRLLDQLIECRQEVSPFVDELSEGLVHRARWAIPTLLGEVSYQEWTRRGRLRHPVWEGLRAGRHPASIQKPVLIEAPRVSAPSGLVGAIVATSGAGKDGDRELGRPGGLSAENHGADTSAARAGLSAHFFYNAINAIAALVKADPARARELLVDFAGFTRYRSRGTGGSTTLADELENVERYLALEQARLEERLRVAIRIVPQVMQVTLPLLTLHRVVEDAVRHGIEEAPSGGSLAISTLDAGSCCVVTIAVDGPGLNWRAELDDVDLRLRDAFGDEYGLLVRGTPGVGTLVTLRLPRIRY